MKHLFSILFLVSLSLAVTAQDTVKTFQAPITIRISNDTLATKVFGRTATASNLLIDWKDEQIVINWKIAYFDLADSAINLDAFISPYYRPQIADKSIFVNGATGDNIALTESDFLALYGVDSLNVNEDSTITHGYKKTASGSYYFQNTPTNNIMDGWSAYMYFSTQPVPLRNLVKSAGLRLAERGGMQK